MSRPTRSMALLALSLSPLWTMAGVSPVSVTFQNGTTAFATGATGSANYLVSMDSSMPSGFSLSLSPSAYPWVTQVTTGTSACTAPAAPICTAKFTLTPGGSCCLMLSLDGTGIVAGSYFLSPVVATTPTTYQYTVVSPTPVTVSAASAATLTTGVQTLALSVNDTSTNLALTGHARQVTIHNTSTTTTATNVTYTTQNLAPANPTILSNATPNTACGNIAPLGTCVLTITPTSSTPSATPYDLAPTPITLTIAGSNTNTLTLSVNILAYGSVYQSGYVYSIDDSTVNTGSVGGKVAALTDQKPAYPNGIAWDADPACATSPYTCTLQTNAWDFNHGENLSTVPGSTNPDNTGTNGPGDTWQIFSVLNGHNGDTNNPANYAAAVCTTYAAGGYANWYLPAICEMGPASNGSGCTVGFQNMVSNLSTLLSNTVPCTTPTGCLAGLYWSSTEYSGNPQGLAGLQYFSAGGSGQYGNGKFYQLGVRCSRALSL